MLVDRCEVFPVGIRRGLIVVGVENLEREPWARNSYRQL